MNPDTLLLRQIHPIFIQAGQVTSQAFKPTPKDESKLSVYNGDLISPLSSFEHYTIQLGLSSAGVLAVCKTECDLCDLPVLWDGIPFPEHCTLDFTSFTRTQIEKTAKILKRNAVTRGWLYNVND